MAFILTPPSRVNLKDLKGKTSIFLAGSIEMGRAIPWQDKLAEIFSAEDKLVILNPRRPDWDSSWKQDPTPGTKFHEQVTWEQDYIEAADIVVFYFDPKTQSPITLLELGQNLNNSKTIIVCCNKDYFRYGNVKIVCDRAAWPVLQTFDELVSAIKEVI